MITRISRPALLALSCSLAVAGSLRADPPPASAASAPPAADPAAPASPPAPPEEAPPALDERVVALEGELEALRRANADMQAALEGLRKPKPVSHLTVPDDVHIRLGGYVDVGAFASGGDGVAYVRDPGKVGASSLPPFSFWIPLSQPTMPDLAKVPWVFFGDPWANPVNAQGDSADLGLDRTNIDRFDPIASGGAPSFLVNTVNADVVATIGEDLLAEVSLNVEPRTGRLGSPGDLLDVDLAYIEYKALRGENELSLFAGKMEPVFGREYRTRKAPDRFGVTPSLIARYTTGTPTGLKVRGRVFDGGLVVAASVTNGGTMTEKFAHFTDEIDVNFFKTGAARVSTEHSLDVGELPVFVDLGASGSIGAQDGQPTDDALQWQWGIDGKIVVGDLTAQLEYLRAHADGGGVNRAPSLQAEGAYLELDYQILPWLGAVVRGDARRALLFAYPNLYITDDVRAAVGLRFDWSWNLIGKIEYLRIQELTGPEIDDDVVTSSFIVRF